MEESLHLYHTGFHELRSPLCWKRRNKRMAQLLLFNIRGDKLRRIRMLSFKLGLRCLEVAPENFSKTLGALCGRAEDIPAVDTDDAPVFGGEMLVMDGLSSAQFHGLLDGLRRERAAVALKAVVTESNARWSAARLYRELSAEHEAMEKLKGKSIHRI